MISPRPGIQQFAVAVAQRPSSVPGGSKAASGSGVHASRRRATSAVVSLTDDTLRIALGGDGAAQVEGRILVGGDVCPNDALERSFSGQAARAFWGDVGDAVREHDVAVCNLECPLTRRGTQIPKIGPHLRADPLCAHGVRAGGFGVASLANNHILDMGAEGVQDTLAACAEAGLQTVGAGVTLEAARQPLIARLGSTSVALVAVCEREFSIATETSPGAAPLDAVETFRQIRVARAEADVIIAIVHGGNEHYALPSPWLLETCRFLAEAGASAVICHHSHVASGFEVFDGVPIVYGTGNLAFWAPDRAEAWYHGYLASVSWPQGALRAWN